VREISCIFDDDVIVRLREPPPRPRRERSRESVTAGAKSAVVGLDVGTYKIGVVVAEIPSHGVEIGIRTPSKLKRAPWSASIRSQRSGRRSTRPS
jgi:hypothetical protein